MSKIKDFLLCFSLALIIITTCVWWFSLRMNTTSGTSMFPSLFHGDTFVTCKADQYKIGDIVTLQYKNIVLVKRIIGTPN